jgi:APA family basic amino acid/polyamine antiporter
MCSYLMFQLPLVTWIRFILWLGVGLAFYFAYGVRHSILQKRLAGRS